MPFTCFACKKKIDVGNEEMVVDGAKAYHKPCFQETVDRPTVDVPSVFLAFPPSSPAPSTPAPGCSICGKPCISRCPVCLGLVHSSYGFMNENCGGRHEQVCPGARELRSALPSKQPPPLLQTGARKRVRTPVGKAKKRKKERVRR